MSVSRYDPKRRSSGVMPIGSVASGFLAGVIGVVPAMFVFLTGTLCASIAMAFTPVAKRNWV